MAAQVSQVQLAVLWLLTLAVAAAHLIMLRVLVAWAVEVRGGFLPPQELRVLQIQVGVEAVTLMQTLLLAQVVLASS
jgi:hypothetical protein